MFIIYAYICRNNTIVVLYIIIITWSSIVIIIMQCILYIMYGVYRDMVLACDMVGIYNYSV